MRGIVILAMKWTLLDQIFYYWFKELHLYLTNFNNRIGFKNIVNKYLKGKYIDVCENIFSFEKFIKSFVNIDRKINIIIENYQPKTKIKYCNKKNSY